MSVRKFSRKVTLGLHSISIREYRIVLCLVALIAAGTTIFTAYKVGYTAAQEDIDVLYNLPRASHSDWPNQLNFMHASMSVAFTIAMIGLWLRRAVGLLLSIIAMAWVGIIYVWWYFYSLEYLRNLEIPDFTSEMRHIGTWRDAMLWDVVILVALITLCIWIIRVLIISVWPSDRERSFAGQSP